MRVAAIDDALHQLMLLVDHPAGHRQTEHAEGIGDAIEHFHLRLKLGWHPDRSCAGRCPVHP